MLTRQVKQFTYIVDQRLSSAIYSRQFKLRDGIVSAEKAYAVENVMGCRIVTGPVPIPDLMAIMAEPEGEEWLTDLNLGNKLGATMVLGTKECLDRLAGSEEIQARITGRALGIRQQIESEGGVVPQAAFDWLVIGERGKSSDALFAFFTQATSMASRSHPHDTYDLRRCRLLLDCVPEFRDRLSSVASLSPAWAGIVNVWPSLCEVMDAESPNWKNALDQSTKTTALLRSVLERAQ